MSAATGVIGYLPFSFFVAVPFVVSVTPYVQPLDERALFPPVDQDAKRREVGHGQTDPLGADS